VLKLLALQHDEYDDAGSIIEWAARRGHSLETVVLTRGGKLPPSLDFDILFIMGGTMNVYAEDKFPWLAEEKVFIKKAVEAGKTAVGFCLGGQLLAAALGGRVTRNKETEIGWRTVNFNKTAQEHPVLSVFGESAVIFQWHSDTFSVLPENAKLIASNDVCAHHGFIYNDNVFAFQFHLELTYQIAYYFANELEKSAEIGDCVQNVDEIRRRHGHIVENNKLMFEFLDKLVENNF
jgi:GMP synthase-like glutamine amidotransferase